MKLTVVRKLGIGIGTLLVLILFLGLVSLWQTQFIESKIREITEVEEPTSVAAFEMEINLIGTGFAVVAYLHDHDPIHLQRIAKDEADFEYFQRRYHELAESEEGKALGRKVDAGYTKFKFIADELIAIEDEQTRAMDIFGQNLVEIDELLDDYVQVSIKPDDPKAYEKMHAALEMEINVNGIAKGLGNFLRTHDLRFEERVHDDEGDFLKYLEVYTALPLSELEIQWIERVHDLFDHSVQLAKYNWPRILSSLTKRKRGHWRILSRSAEYSMTSWTMRYKSLHTKTSHRPRKMPFGRKLKRIGLLL